MAIIHQSPLNLCNQFQNPVYSVWRAGLLHAMIKAKLVLIEREENKVMKVVILAPKGHMASLIVRAAAAHKSLEIVGAVGPAGRDYIGRDLGQLVGLGYDLGVHVTDDLEACIDQCDAIIDFSTVELSMEALKTVIKHRKALICGTTGFTQEQVALLHGAASEIPVLHASNTSYVVNLMYRLLAIAAKGLEGRADMEIIEMHPRTKKDAPSGTAKEMADAINEALTSDAGDMKFHSIRAGDIPSSHTVLFGCMGERLEITHHAYNWECYATGTCDAALFIHGKKKGLYTMKDVIAF